MEGIILSQLSKALNLSKTEISLQSTFNSIGGDSIAALRISDGCKRLGVLISISSIFTSKDIAELLRSGTWAMDHVIIAPHENDTGTPQLPQVGTNGSSSYHLSPTNNVHNINGPCDKENGLSTQSSGSDMDDTERELSQRIIENYDARKATRMMSLQSFLAADTIAHPGNNIISYFQEYPPARVPALREAWRQVIQSEPIFRTVFKDEMFWDGDTTLFFLVGSDLYGRASVRRRIGVYLCTENNKTHDGIQSGDID